MRAYLLREYEYDSYSYSGITEHSIHVHSSEGGARHHAAELGLEIVEYPKDVLKHATLEVIDILD